MSQATIPIHTRLALLLEEFREWGMMVLGRIGHVWIGNLLVLAAFAWRLLLAAPYVLGELGSLAFPKVVGRWGRQFFRTFFRGVVLVAVLGLAAALGIGAVARLAGTFLQPFVESVLLVILVRDVAPLGLAVALAARMGASITAKLGVFPATIGQKTVTFGPREITKRVVPLVVAGVATAPLFFFVLAWFILAGYETAGDLGELAKGGAGRFFRGEMWPPLADGAWRATAFGGIVSFVAAALGVRSAEHFESPAGEALELNDAVWEASVISVLFCAFWTIYRLAGAGAL